MKRLLLASLAFLLPSAALAWEPITTHPKLAKMIVNEPRIHAMLLKHGFSEDSISGLAAKAGEPDDQAWGGLSSWSAFRDKWRNIPPTYNNIWKLLHTVADAGVPVTHGPANPIFDSEVAQTVVEAQGTGDVTWPQPHYYTVGPQSYSSYPDYYNTYVGAFASEMVGIAAQVEYYWWSTPACSACYLGLFPCAACNMRKYVVPAQQAALRAAWEIVYAYLYCQYYHTWDAPFPQFSPGHPGYDAPYVTDYAQSCNSVTLSDGNDVFFPVKLLWGLGPEKQYTGDVRIDWGDGSIVEMSGFDVTKVCRTENTCRWRKASHQYNTGGTHAVKVSYFVKFEYVLSDSPYDPITDYFWSEVSSTTVATQATDAACAATSGVLASGKALYVGGEIRSPNGKYRLTFQSDGNLVLYQGSSWIGHTHTFDHVPRADRCVMQTDGNLVLYAGNQPVWNTQTWNNPGTSLYLNDDGTMSIKGGTAGTVWTFTDRLAVFPGNEIF